VPEACQAPQANFLKNFYLSYLYNTLNSELSSLPLATLDKVIDALLSLLLCPPVGLLHGDEGGAGQLDVTNLSEARLSTPDDTVALG
jgi:hypothetical protein